MRREPARFSRLSQSSVLGFRLREDRDVGIGVYPEREQVLIGSRRFLLVAGHSERSSELQARVRVQWICEHDTSMVEDPLELRSGICRAMCRKVGLAPNIDGIKRAEAPVEADAAHSKIEARGDLQGLNRRGGITSVQ